MESLHQAESQLKSHMGGVDQDDLPAHKEHLTASQKQSIKTAETFQNALATEEQADASSTQASLAEAQAEIDAQMKADKEAKAKAQKEMEARLAEQ